jgi:hypothetical protein
MNTARLFANSARDRRSGPSPKGTDGSQCSPWLGPDGWIYFGLAVWLIMIVGGMTALWRYEMTPGQSHSVPLFWPEHTGLSRMPGRSTIVMLAHPRCPCTRASVRELAGLMSRLGSMVMAYVLVVRPEGVPQGWEQTDVWRRAEAIPGVVVRADTAGTLARRFGAVVSGHAVVYDAAGQRVFSGGITPGRGHEGDNAGRRRIVSLLTSGRADRSDGPTFGCELSGEQPPGR